MELQTPQLLILVVVQQIQQLQLVAVVDGLVVVVLAKTQLEVVVVVWLMESLMSHQDKH